MKKIRWNIYEKREGWGPAFMCGQVLAIDDKDALKKAAEKWGAGRYTTYRVLTWRDYAPCRECGEIEPLHPWEACRTFKNLVMHSRRTRPKRKASVGRRP